MLADIKWPPTRTYKTNGTWQPKQFFTDGLMNSKEFNILLGYFSSSAINVLAYGFASFIANGGKVKMVINDALQNPDIDTLINAYDENTPLPFFDLDNFDKLVELFNKRDTHFFECIAYLIREKRIEIVAIRTKWERGISHYKKGYFFDGENFVGFKGSCNFTANALLANLEDVTCIIPEDADFSKAQFEEVKNDFYRYFNKQEDVIYIDPSTVEKSILKTFKEKKIQELIDDEKFINEELKKITQQNVISKNLKESVLEINIIPTEPSLQNVQLRDYQMEAYNAWVNNDYHGIFAMATGTGKTFTAINCIIQEYLKNPDKTYRALVLVPSIVLVKQWEDEVKRFGFSHIILVSSKSPAWQNKLDRALFAAQHMNSSFIIISTYKSFTTDFFQAQMPRLPLDTILIADEAHNIASKNVENRLNSIQHLMRKLALSATPKRIYDPEGTTKMESFFNDTEPYIFRFSMRKAISEGYLSEYYYYPHLVELTPEELKEYNLLSIRIAQLYEKNSGNQVNSQLIENLLLRRKTIIHKAENKLESALYILNQIFANRKNLSYTLVFVPEGIQNVDDTFEDDSGLVDELIEPTTLIDLYSKKIAQIHEEIAVNKIVSGDKDRELKLKHFSRGLLDVLTAMKCLDEGVDIPRAKTAIFCSSTGNPRQYIQRRGRVLRNYGNQIAEIHDLIVVPLIGETENGTFNIERNLVSSELRRVAYFASLSKNYQNSETVLKDICSFYNLNIYSLAEELEEQ